MVYRRILIVAMWSVGLMSWLTSPVVAQNADRSAEQLLARGVAEYRAGQFEAAQQTLKQIAVDELPAAKQRMLAQALQAVEAKVTTAQPAKATAAVPATPVAPKATAKEPTAADQLADARQAFADGKWAAAFNAYQSAASSADATDAQRKEAAGGASASRDKLNDSVAGLRKGIDLAEVELSVAGRAVAEGRDLFAVSKFNSAERRLLAARNSGVDLGFFDRDRIERQLRRIAEYREDIAPSTVAAAGGVIDAAAQDTDLASPRRIILAQAADDKADAAAGAAGQAAPADAAAAPAADDKPADAAAPAPGDAPAAPAAGANDALSEAKRLFVQEMIQEADRALAEGQPRVAAQALEKAERIDPENAEVKTKLEAVRAELNKAVGEKELLPTFTDTMDLRRQAAVAEYKELFDKADALRSQSNFTAANEAIQQAKLILDRNRRFLPPSEYDQLRNEATDLAAQIETQRVNKDREDQLAIQKQREDEAARRRIRAAEETQQEVQRLLRRANDLRKEQQYEKALELLDQALFLDPNNVAAQALREVIQDVQVFTLADSSIKKRTREVALSSAQNIGATIPFSDVLTYPTDWPQITAVRLASLDTGGGESEVNRRTAQQLRQSVPVKFDANRLVNVIDYLRNTTGLNFFVNWAALEAVGIERDTPITLDLTNVPAEQALRLVLAQAGSASELEPIGFSIIEGIVTISTERDLKRTTDTRVYDIRDLLVQVPNFAGAPQFDLNSALSNTNSGGSSGAEGVAQSSTSLFGDQQQNQQPTLTRQELIEQITTLVQDTVGKQEEWAAYGGDVSSLRELNGNLIVKSTPENHRQIIQLLSQLRETRAIQIHIEARFLLVDQNFLEEVGVDFDMQVDEIGNKFGPIKLAQDSISVAGRASTGLPGTFGAPLDVAAIGAFIPMEGYSPGSGRSLDFNVSFIDDFKVNLIVRASESSRRSINLTAPRVTLFNGQRSNVIIARQISFVSDLEPIPGATGFDPTLSVTQSGVVLDVEATVSADRRYVTMTAQPSLATVLQPIRTIPQQGAVNNNVGGVGVGGVGTSFGFVEAPELELTTVRTSVSVPDKGTLLMGGQRLVADVEVESGVPVLSKVPLLNRLFTNRTTIKDERTLLILIKPTILLQNEQEDALFPGLLENPAQYNIGRSFGTPTGITSGGAP